MVRIFELIILPILRPLRPALCLMTLAVAGMLVFSHTAPALAQAAGATGATVEQSVQELERRNEEFDTFGWPAKGRFNVAPDALQTYVDFNRYMWNEHGISWFYKPTLMGQFSGRPANNSTANFQHNILLYWRMHQDDAFGSFGFVFSALQVWQLTATTGVDFTQALGTNFASSDSVSDSGAVKALYLRHDLPGGMFNYRVGQVEISGIQGGCAYSCDDTDSFFSQPLSAYPASTMPGQGFGLIGEFLLGDIVKFEAGIADALGNGNVNFSRPFDTGDWAYAASVALVEPFPDAGYGQYKVAYYSVDPTGQGTPNASARTQGLTITIEQDVGDVGLFARYATAWGRTGAVDRTAATGLVWKRPFGNEEDWLGVGFGWVSPTASGTNSEYVAETYYRLQLTPLTQVTAGAMAVIQPSYITSDIEGVLNLRARMYF